MRPFALDAAQPVWPILVGTLGGVTITAFFGLLTAFLTHRWQSRNAELQFRLSLLRESRQAKRESYVKYIISAQDVFDRSFDLYVINEGDPIELHRFEVDPPAEFAAVVVRNESLRVEVMLIAGPLVQETLARYDRWLKKFYPRAASGNDVNVDAADNQLYHNLVDAMRQEVVDAELWSPGRR